MNDIAQAVPDHNVKLFADYTNLFISGRNIDLLNQKANESLKHLNNWFLANKLSLNLEKNLLYGFSIT